MEALITNNVSDEEYVIHKAKSAFKSDPLSAKAWMITAKTLYPDNFGVQVLIFYNNIAKIIINILFSTV